MRLVAGAALLLKSEAVPLHSVIWELRSALDQDGKSSLSLVLVVYSTCFAAVILSLLNLWSLPKAKVPGLFTWPYSGYIGADMAVLSISFARLANDKANV